MPSPRHVEMPCQIASTPLRARGVILLGCCSFRSAPDGVRRVKHPNDANIQYCLYCAAPLTPDGTGHSESVRCRACNKIVYTGPQVLVLVAPFAEGKVLLMKRGLPPYVGTWAPPGG